MDKKNCDCLACQCKKIKARNNKANLDRLAHEFEVKSGGIITRQDIYKIAKKEN